jgi:hypothetical protein
MAVAGARETKKPSGEDKYLAKRISPPSPVHDGARGIQFLRSKAKKWNIDEPNSCSQAPAVMTSPNPIPLTLSSASPPASGVSPSRLTRLMLTRNSSNQPLLKKKKKKLFSDLKDYEDLRMFDKGGIFDFYGWAGPRRGNGTNKGSKKGKKNSK